MAIQVNLIGNIGNDHVDIKSNAASEYTLDQLLKATINAGLKNEKALLEMAKANEVDSNGLNALDQAAGSAAPSLSKMEARVLLADMAFNKLAPIVNMVGEALTKLSQNTGQGSDLLSSFKGLGLGVGDIIGKYGKLLNFQEENFKTYQQITTAGVNFGGNLTELRHAIGDTYLTVDQFTKLMQENAETFSRMGGSVDDGAQKFRAVSRELNRTGGVGDSLRALGYTSEELNNGLAAYIKNLGPLKASDLDSIEKQKALAQSTGEYLKELDSLAKFTGTSRKKIEDEQAKANLNEAYQRKKASLGEEEKKKLLIAEARAAATGIPGAIERVMEETLNFGPVTEASRNLTGMAPEVSAGITDMARAAKTAGVGMDQVNAGFDRAVIGAKNTADGLGHTGDYIAIMNGKYAGLINGIDGLANRLDAAGIKTTEALRNSFDAEKTKQDAIAKGAKKEGETSAKDMADIQSQILETTRNLNNGIQALSDESMNAIKTAIDALTTAINTLAEKMQTMPEVINRGFDVAAIVIALAALTAELVLLRKAGGLTKDLLDASRGKGTTPPGTPSLPEPKPNAPSGSKGPVSGKSTLDKATGVLARVAVAGVVDSLAGSVGFVGGKKIDEKQDEENRKKMNFFEKAEDSIARGVENIGSAVGLTNLANEARATRIQNETEYFKKKQEEKQKSEAAKEKKISQELKEPEKNKDLTKKDEENILAGAVKQLNNTMDRVLNTMKETADNTGNTAKKLDGRSWWQGIA